MILGTRGSPLALAQSGWVRERLLQLHPGLTIGIQVIRTAGDQARQSPPDAPFPEGADAVKGVFVKEIEEALLAGRIDLAVHSLKDLPTVQPAGLRIGAIPAREDPREALVSRDGLGLEALPRGGTLGSSSPRRAAQVRALRPDLVVAPVRGNVETRIRKMMEGRFDAVMLAMAGLTRLGLTQPGRIDGARVCVVPEESCLPAVGQGALAIETRGDDPRCAGLVAPLHDEGAAAEVSAERAFLAGLGGGCRVPVAARATAGPDGLVMRGLVAAPDGGRLIRVEGRAEGEEPTALGARLAREALAMGAESLLRDTTS